MERIELLEICNFKSYRFKHTIGPFRNFTAIIGPNGSGKSNLMDAICFVLGIDSAKLRSGTLKDLISEQDGSTQDAEKSYVKLVFVDKEGNETRFQRTITNNASSTEYKIDDQVVTWKDYDLALKEKEISVKNPNCLVFQGTVESIARQSAKDRTVLLEQISGSGELKEEYEQLESEQLKAIKQSEFLSQQDRGLKAELKQYKMEQKEADEHAAKSKHVQDLNLQSILFQLFYLNKDITELATDAGAKKKEYENADLKFVSGKQRIETERQKVAAEASELNTLKRTLAAIESKVEAGRPALISLRRNVEHAAQKLATEQRLLEETGLNAKQQESRLNSYKNELQELKEQFESWKKEDAELASLSKEPQLSQAQLKEYAQLKETARKSLVNDRVSLAQLQKESENDETNLSDILQPRLAELESKHAQLSDNELPNLKMRLRGMETAKEELESQRKAANDELLQLDNSTQRWLRERNETQEALEQIDLQIRNAKISLSEMERTRAMDEGFATMKRLFPGVYGRVADLIEPLEIYKHAVSVALGKHLDSIVVADSKTTGECLDYLKNQRIGTATFLPLDILADDTHPPYDELRALDPRSIKPIIDVVKFDPQFRKAIEFVCGSTLVCADLKTAMSYSFEGNHVNQPKHRICTLDGTLIAKNGFMTGGKFKSSKTETNRWDTKKYEAVKEDREKLSSKMTELTEKLRNVSRTRELQNLLSSLESKFSSVNLEIAMVTNRISSITKEILSIENLLQTERSSIKEVEKAIAKRKILIDKQHAKIASMEESIFESFSKKVGIPNLSAWDEDRKNRAKTRSEKQLLFQTQISRVDSLVQYTQSQMDQGQHSQQEHERKAIQATELLEKSKNELENLIAENELISSQQQQAKEQVSTKKESLERLESKLKDMVRENDTRQNLMRGLASHLQNKTMVLDALREKRHRLFASASSDDIEIPTISGGDLLPRTLSQHLASRDGKQKSDEKKQRKPSRKKKTSKKKDDYGMEIDFPLEEEEEDEEEEGIESTQKMEIDGEHKRDGGNPLLENGEDALNQMRREMELEDDIKVNFAKLPNELQKCTTAAQREEKHNKIIMDLQSAITNLESIAPNYKANDKAKEIQEKINDLNRQMKEATQSVKDLQGQFAQVRQLRNSMFMAAFRHINDKIRQIYKDLTRGYGNVQLLLHSIDEPYLNPVEFSVIAPSKTASGSNELSGGEKSMLAIALLFAIQDFKRSPFFILDEVDAALDKSNILILAQYLRKRSTDMQFIIISLKDLCFNKADSLLGVYMNRHSKSSQTLTLDLTKYPERERQ